jgi:uncharacterized protein (TIGR03000 family)
MHKINVNDPARTARGSNQQIKARSGSFATEKAMYQLLLSAVVGVGLWGLFRSEALAATLAGAPATIVVRLPSDARLIVDGAATKSTSGLRRFITPPLARGKDFHYVFQAEFVRGDETITIKKHVTVRAGRETDVSLGLSSGWDNPAYQIATGGAGVTETRAYYYNPDTADSGANRTRASFSFPQAARPAGFSVPSAGYSSESDTSRYYQRPEPAAGPPGQYHSTWDP